MILGMRRSMTLAVAVVVTATVSAVQQPQFRGGVELVTVDVRVLDKDGDPLLGLEAGAFTLKVDGKDRPIKSVMLLRSQTSRDVPTGPDAPDQPRRPGVPVGAPPLILVFDHENIRPGDERAAVEGAGKALEALPPWQRAALVTLPNGRIVVNLTTDRAAIKKGLEQIVGGAHVTSEAIDGTGGSTKSARVMCGMYALRDFLDGLAAVPGPKTLVLVSSGFTCESPGSDRSTRSDRKMDLQDLSTAAAAARAQVYVLQPNSTMVIDASRKLRTGLPPDEVQRRDDMVTVLENIATVTGGDLLRLSGTADAAYGRVLRETAAYYELTFEPLESDRNGKPHSISVKVDRPKTTVRARQSFSLPK
jgi:VWFA-related protein